MLLNYKGVRTWGICSGLDVVSLVPGPNTIADHVFDSIKDVKEIKDALKEGVLEIVVPVKGEKKDGQDEKSEIGSLSVKDAKALVAETFNTEELKKWKEEETRKGVIDAIENQLEKIESERLEASKNSDEPKAE